MNGGFSWTFGVAPATSGTAVFLGGPRDHDHLEVDLDPPDELRVPVRGGAGFLARDGFLSNPVLAIYERRETWLGEGRPWRYDERVAMWRRPGPLFRYHFVRLSPFLSRPGRQEGKTAKAATLLELERDFRARVAKVANDAWAAGQLSADEANDLVEKAGAEKWPE